MEKKLNKVFIDTKQTVWDREIFYTKLSKEEVIEKIREIEDFEDLKEEVEYQLQTDTFDSLSIEENNFNPIMEICFMENVDLKTDNFYDYDDVVGFEPINLEETIGTYTNLSFSDALVLLKKGYQIRVPEWEGYWKLENNKIMAHCKGGCIEEANQFQGNILRNDWIAEEIVEKEDSIWYAGQGVLFEIKHNNLTGIIDTDGMIRIQNEDGEEYEFREGKQNTINEIEWLKSDEDLKNVNFINNNWFFIEVFDENNNYIDSEVLDCGYSELEKEGLEFLKILEKELESKR